jgi:hypothetical protein
MKRLGYAAFMGVLVGATVAIAQPAPQGPGLNAPAGKSVQSARQAGKPDFTSLGDAALTPNPQVARGVLVDPLQWPATLISQPSGCTATFVGSRVILTAAHCVGHNQPVTAHIRGRTRNAVCEHHPNYSAEFDNKRTDANWDKTSADYAICLVDAGDAVTGVKFEVIGAGPDLVKKNAEVRLLGFGCSGDAISPDGYGVLRTAAAKVVEVPTAARPNNNYIITDWQGSESFKDAVGGALCPGDSGGAVYWPFSNTGRRIVGVNSRTQTKGDQAQTLTGISYLSSTLTPTATSFLVNWAALNNVEICGITAGAQDCRQ